MRRLLNRYGILLPLLLGAILIHNWAESPDPVSEEGDFDMRSTRSDYYLEAFRTRKFDADGRQRYEVSGDSLIHYPEERRSDIQAPDIALFQDEGRWQVTARRGEFSEAPEVFRLREDVRITRDGENAVEIRTAELELLPEAREVRTDQLIEIVAQGWQLQATGLRSTLDSGTLELLADVRGTYSVPRDQNEVRSEAESERENRGDSEAD